MKPALNDQLVEKLSDVSKLIHQSGSVKIPDIQLSIREIAVLGFIHKNSPATINQIAHHLKITMPTTTVLLDKLEKNKLILRVQNKKDKRSTFIKPSPKTAKIIDQLLQQRRKKIKLFLSFLSTSEKQTLYQILNKLTLKLCSFYEKK